MATEITQGGLSWKASIDYSQIPKDIDAIQKMLKDLGVGTITPESISAPIIEAEKQIQAVIQQTAKFEIDARKQVAEQVIQIENQVAAHAQKVNEQWRAEHDEQIRALFQFQDQLNQSGTGGNVFQTAALPIPDAKAQAASLGLDAELLKVLNDAKRIYSELDQETAAYIEELLELELQMGKIAATQQGLDEAYDNGKMTLDDYSLSSAALAVEQKKISDSIDLINQRQKDFLAINNAGTNSINQKKAQLQQLEEAYRDLSDAERASASGQKLKADIQSLSREIKGLDPKKVEEVKVKTQTAFAELRKLKDEMARNPGSPMFDTWRNRAQELQESMEAVRNELKLATSDSAGIDALADGIRGIVGGFSAAAGAVSLFTGQNEEAEKAVQKTMAALALLNGVQELSRALEKESALNVYLTSLMRNKDTAAAVAQSAAITGQTAATTSATVATRSLTAAMLANPALTLVAGITALVSAYLIFRKTSNDVKSSQELLAAAGKKVSDTYAEQTAKILPYLEALKSSNVSEQERMGIYEKLKDIDEDIVRGLDAKTLSYQNLKFNVDGYLTSLRQQLALESRQAAITESIKAEDEIRKQIKAQEELVEVRRKAFKDSKEISTDSGGSTFGVTNTQDALTPFINAKDELDKLNSSLVEQQRVTEELASGSSGLILSQQKQTVEYGRTVEAIDKEIAEQKKLQNQRSTTAEQYITYQRRINELEAERKRITGESEKDVKSRTKAEDQLNAILDKRRSILEAIAGLERDASQSGMLKEASEIDKINEKYDRQIDALKKVNEQIALFNRRNPNRQQSPLGEDEINRINAARATEIANQQYKEDAKRYLDALKLKREAFEALETAQESGSIEIAARAREVYQEQVGKFSNYLGFLQSEAAKLIPKLFSKTFTIGDADVLAGLNKEYFEAVEKAQEKVRKNQVEDYRKLMAAAKTYNIERAGIEKKYNDLYRTLVENRKNMSEDEFKARKEALEQSKEAEMDVIAKELLRQYNAYRQFEKGFDNLGRNATKHLVTALEKVKEELKDNINAVNLLNKAIQGIKEGAADKNEVKFQEVLSMIDSVMTDATIKLSESLSITMKQITQLVGNIQTLFDGSASTSDQVGSLIGIINFIVVGIRDAFLTSEDMADPLQSQIDFYNQISNEIQYQNDLLIRQKTLLDDLVGNARVSGTLDLMDALRKKEEDSLKALKELNIEVIQRATDYYVDPIFGARPSQSGVTGALVNILTLGQAKKNTELDLVSIDTSQMETIEDFADLLGEIKRGGGKLNGKKVVEEDIKALEMLIETYDQAIAEQKELKRQLDQLFTGTTTNAIADTIVEGFRQGKRSAQDFASDFEEMMRGAILNSLKIQALEEPIMKFYEEFSQASGADGMLTPEEIDGLKAKYEEIIRSAGQQFEDLQKITNIDLSNANEANSLKGGIKAMTEQTAELLAGQFGGLRMTAIDQLQMATRQLTVLQEISYNTDGTNKGVRDSLAILKDFQLQGIKVR